MHKKYVWGEEMSVGVQELDEQHRHLFVLVRDILDLTARHPNTEMQRKHELLDGIMDYNLYHIRFEEERMHEFECEDPEHLKAHQWYREEVGKLFDAASPALRNGASDADDLCRTAAVFTGDWHLEHIRRADQDYTQCFNDHGLH